MTDREFAIRNAKQAYQITKEYGCALSGLEVTMDGYEWFDDHSGIIILLDYEGNVL